MKSRRSCFSNAKIALFFVAGLAAQAQSGNMSYLDNGKIRIGVDLSLGGVITYLSADGGDNIINSADLGRQIQQSYYSGPRPYGEAAPAWKNWPWNPIGTAIIITIARRSSRNPITGSCSTRNQFPCSGR